jgi:threonine dehydrogenase-like Zn-dependent dehydrogenase
MKIYRTKGEHEFEIDGGAEVFDPAFVRLKVSSVCITVADLALYEGRTQLNAPVCPCHAATAIVSEDRPEYDLKRGSRVILNPYIQGDAGGDTKIFGVDTDGFLRDFTALSIDNIIPFPEDVKENEAIFTEMLAVALAAVNALTLNKGDYVAIVGSSVVGDSVLSNLVAQLVLYYQAIPIYISGDKRLLEIAKKCGVYYTVDETNEDVYQRVFSITGGHMAEHTILHAGTGVSPHFLFSLAGRGGQCLIISVTKSMPRLETNIGVISQKELKIKGVSCGADEFNAAVNLIAQKQLDFSNFIDKSVPFEKTAELFAEISANPMHYVAPVIKVTP